VQAQVWTLGLDLHIQPAEASKGLTARYDKALRTARRAAALPHDMRVKVLEASFTAQWSYGAFLRPPDASQEKYLLTCVEQALAGSRRAGWNRSLFWTVVYKGHRFIPQYTTLRHCVQVLRLIMQSGEAAMQTDMAHVWNHLRRYPHAPEDLNVFANFHRCLRRLGGQWQTINTFTLPGRAGTVTFDLLRDPWPNLMHRLRTFCKWHTLETMGRRNWDIPHNLDYDNTRTLLKSSTMSFLDKGLLRTILMGALRPEINKSEHGAARILCARCAGEADTSGHRFWRCPATQPLRTQLLPPGLQIHLLPTVLTRFGVATEGLCLQTVQAIQRYLIAVVRATSVVDHGRPDAHELHPS
jgi:hypothetical protein